MDSFRTGDLAYMPISSLTIAACIGVYVYQRVKGTDLSKVWFSYNHIVAKKEIWRIITSAYTHGSIIHLAMNMFTALQQGMDYEARIGWLNFAKATYFLVMLSGLVTLAVSAALNQVGYSRYANMPAVGYSGVLFGIFALQSLQKPFATVKLLYVLPVPFIIVPFIYLVVMQILVRNVSFIGHAAGIAAGYLTFYLRTNVWFDDIVFGVALALTSILCGYSYVKMLNRRHWQLPSQTSNSSGGGKARIVNGVLIRG